APVFIPLPRGSADHVLPARHERRPCGAVFAPRAPPGAIIPTASDVTRTRSPTLRIPIHSEDSSWSPPVPSTSYSGGPFLGISQRSRFVLGESWDRAGFNAEDHPWGGWRYRRSSASNGVRAGTCSTTERTLFGPRRGRWSAGHRR